jgi:hypothetical protein
VPRLDVIGVIVADLTSSIGFYQRLGLQFPEDPDPEGHGHVETTLPGGLRFTLDTEESIRSFNPDWSPPSGGHRIAVAFRCESPEDVDSVYQGLSTPARRATRNLGTRSGASATPRRRIPTATSSTSSLRSTADAGKSVKSGRLAQGAAGHAMANSHVLEMDDRPSPLHRHEREGILISSIAVCGNRSALLRARSGGQSDG